MEQIECLIIDTECEYYKQAVEMRYRVFFEPSNVSMNEVYDDIENCSIHFVAVREDHVIGYIRLTILENMGLVSQFVVEEKSRGAALVGKKLIKVAEDKAREEKLDSLYGEIRLHVEKAAKWYGFQVSDDVIYSKKTGIPHKRIEKKLLY